MTPEYAKYLLFYLLLQKYPTLMLNSKDAGIASLPSLVTVLKV